MAYTRIVIPRYGRARPSALCYDSEKQRLVFIAGGAAWFWDWASAVYPEAVQILDYYHCKSYLWAFAKVYFKDKGEQAPWVDRQQNRLFADQVIAEIACWPHRGVEDRIARDKILSYYRNNCRRMLYGSYRRRGLLIGSGPIEAAHRNVIQQRLKLAGQRWTQAGMQFLYLDKVEPQTFR